jgi:hypothetical protein
MEAQASWMAAVSSSRDLVTASENVFEFIPESLDSCQKKTQDAKGRGNAAVFKPFLRKLCSMS